MLHAKDLMIGDWVNLAPGDNNNNINPVQVVAIDYDKEISEDNVIDIVFPITGLIQFNYSQRSLKPIPLTPKILEKNGFVENRGVTSWIFRTKQEDLIDIYGVDNYHLSINIEDTQGCGKGYRWLLYNLTIHYVHELQHALQLYGIEKEIEL